jgi:hypothetical protein
MRLFMLLFALTLAAPTALASPKPAKLSVAAKVRKALYRPGRLPGPRVSPLIGTSVIGRSRILSALVPKKFRSGTFLVDPITMKRVGSRYRTLSQLDIALIGQSTVRNGGWHVVDPLTGLTRGPEHRALFQDELENGTPVLIARTKFGRRTYFVDPETGLKIGEDFLWITFTPGVPPRALVDLPDGRPGQQLVSPKKGVTHGEVFERLDPGPWNRLIGISATGATLVDNSTGKKVGETFPAIAMIDGSIGGRTLGYDPKTHRPVVAKGIAAFRGNRAGKILDRDGRVVDSVDLVPIDAPPTRAAEIKNRFRSELDDRMQRFEAVSK